MTSICLKGDCLELMKDLSNNSIDLFMCDLPYGCIACKWDIKIDLVEFWKQIKRLSRTDKTPVLMFCDAKFGVDLIISNPKWFRYELIWNKNKGASFLTANKLPMKSHENIYLFSKKSCNYNRIDEYIEGKQAYTHYRGGSSNVYAVKNMKTFTEQKEGMRCSLSVININRTASKKTPNSKTNRII